MWNSARWHFQVRREDIAFLRHVIEACEGIAFLSTADSQRGVVVLHVPPGCEREAEEVIGGLKTVMRIASLSPADGQEFKPLDAWAGEDQDAF